MADPRFYPVRGPFTLAELAVIGKAEIAAGGDPGRLFKEIAALDSAGPEDISFLDNRRYLSRFVASRAGACFVHPDFVSQAPSGMAVLSTPIPYRSYSLAALAFHPPIAAAPGVHPRATVDPGAELGDRVGIGPGAVVGARVRLGAGVRIGPNAIVADGVEIGENTQIGANASLTHCLIGARVLIYPGARIGQDGFGFTMDASGHVKVPQLGRVIIGDDVEIGANTCIDRGAIGDTVIGEGCIIDNLVQIGHNVQLGRRCVIAAQIGMSGSTRLDDFVVAGGQVGFAGHLRVGAGVRIAAQSGVTKDIPAGLTVGGLPAIPIQEWRRQVATLSRMARRPAKREDG